MSHLNVEIKAKCLDHNKVRRVLKSQGADFRGTDHQVDTYFKVNSGRLKLREGNIENFLIYYDRENKEGPKESKIILFKNNPDSTLKDILINANGILTVVDKKREIYFIKNVKFHIDIVESLGSFIEIEAIDKDGSLGKDKLYVQCQEYMKLLGISESDLISGSYSDLLK
ncbi:MAG: class IV adenylate cyclase [bacterium]|nr:class IV adenylate cyclase [bacterium]